MNRRVVFIIWLALIGVSAISPLWVEPSLFLNQVLSGSLDPSQWFIFTSLGFFPLYFFVFALNEKQPLWRSILYLLGMIFGGFIVFPLEALNNKTAKPLTLTHLVMLATMDSILIAILVWSIFLGDWSVYIRSYQTDLFVYIMTWDFIAIIIVLSYKVISQAPIYFQSFLKQE